MPGDPSARWRRVEIPATISPLRDRPPSVHPPGLGGSPNGRIHRGRPGASGGNPAAAPAPFGNVLRDSYAALERYRLLTYGQQVVRAVRELENPALAAQIHTTLAH